MYVRMIINRNINGIEFGINPEKSASVLCNTDIAKRINGDIYNFIEHLYEVKNEYLPMIATWEITNVCNFNCKFCYINTLKKEKDIFYSYDKMKEVIDDLVKKGLILVYLTGGEVFTHPDFCKIYTYLKEKGVLIVLLTNLSLLDDKHVELFKKYPPLRITTSVYGINEANFYNVTQQNKEQCNIVLENILKLQSNGINIWCQTPINSLTIEDYPKIAEWCFEHNIIYKSNNELFDSYYGESRDEFSIDVQKYNDLKTQIKTIKQEVIMSKQKPIRKFGYKHHFDCIAGKHTFGIAFDLSIRPCFSMQKKDCVSFDGEQSMEEALNKMKEYIQRMQRQVIDYCQGCEATSICTECILSQINNKKNVKEYMKTKCAYNKQKINGF